MGQPDEEQRFHHHNGVDVPVVVLYAEPDAVEAIGRVPDLDMTKEMGVLCPVCDFCPSPELEAYQLEMVMGLHHFEDGN